MTERAVIAGSPAESDSVSPESWAETELRQFRRDVDDVKSEIARAVIGQQRVVQEIFIAILAGGHVLLEGVPGVGKTLLARSFATVLGMGFNRIQCTPDMIPADVTGTDVLVGDEQGVRGIRFQHGPIFSKLVLADEINRATPKTQSAFLEAMEERQVTVAGRTRPLPRPFVVLATQNPIEIEGTFPLPEAQLDRFMFKVVIDYPNQDELRRIAGETTGKETEKIHTVLDPDRILQMQRIIRRIPASTNALDRSVHAVRATHPDDTRATEHVRRFVRFGASPRAVQAIILGAKARAVLNGRCHASDEDLRAVAHAALRHRVLLNFEASTNSVAEDEIITGILDKYMK